MSSKGPNQMKEEILNILVQERNSGNLKQTQWSLHLALTTLYYNNDDDEDDDIQRYRFISTLEKTFNFKLNDLGLQRSEVIMYETALLKNMIKCCDVIMIWDIKSMIS